jgi:GNAT superfamily N-acetyltransferase
MQIEAETLAHLEEDEFLAGEERFSRFLEGELDEDLVIVDDIFEKSVVDILADYPCDFDSLSSPTASIRAPGYIFADHDAGVVLLAPTGDIAGVYLGPDLAISDEHRDRGLGAELVLERVLREGGSPVWELSRPCYTRAGRRAHASAWRLLRDPPFIDQKIRSLKVAYTGAGFVEAPAAA